MSNRRAVGTILAVLALAAWATTLRADQTVTQVYPGITYIARSETVPRPVRMKILVIDLTAPGIRFKLTPPGANLPAPAVDSKMCDWPLVPYEVVRQPTLDFLNASHGQAAINVHFFAPFPNPPGASQTAYAYLIGLAASRGNVYSAFETPVQNYAIVTDVPAVNIDAANNAGIVHRDPGFADGLHVQEDVQLWNALAGSAQIVTNGVKTIPEYLDATHPNGLLTPGGARCSATVYNNSNSWYNAINARTAIGLTQDRKLVLFTVDRAGGSQGMRVGEVADLLIRDYAVQDALNLDGGGSTTMALQDPVTLVRSVVNVSSEAGNVPRSEGSSFAVYSDAELPVTAATVSPAANEHGWNNTPVTVALDATDLATGLSGTFPGWVDQLEYFLSGAQPGDTQVVSGSSTSFGVSTQGVTHVTFFATDAADNTEAAQTIDVSLDFDPPVINGLPGDGCTLWPPNHKLQQVATVTATDAVSGVASLVVTGTSTEPAVPGESDIAVTPDGSGGQVVALRAERLGTGPGRFYTLTATATDVAGNVATVTATCGVPHDQRKK